MIVLSNAPENGRPPQQVPEPSANNLPFSNPQCGSPAGSRIPPPLVGHSR
jgi:hypothetical protein